MRTGTGEPTPARRPGRALTGLGDIGLLALVLAVVLLLVVPLRAWMLDLLIGVNICLSLLVFTLALFLRRPLGFTAFPTVLLIATLYRLALNVASTRLILLEADAGRIIGAFGGLVVGGDLLVGAVIFGILTLVLFLVITKGAERVAEVGARFTLDALPGMQLAIEADLRSGSLTPREVSHRRSALERRSHYYGSLDGAMKFVRGDAIAGLVIIVVNIVGGVAVGVLRHGMAVGEALDTYGRLTVGDGLVTMIPALLISTAAGLLVTRIGQGAGEVRLGRQVAAQLGAEPRALLAAAVLAVVLAVVPGLPAWPFLGLGAVLAGAGGLTALRARRAAVQAGARRADRDRGHGGRPLDLDTAQRLVDELAVEHPVLVRETVPRRISLAGLADQLTLLAEDDIGEDQLFAVLEAVAREPEDLPAEELNQRIRRRLAPTITANLVGDADTLDVAVLDDELEHVLVDGISTTATGTRLALPLELTERVASQCAAAIAGLPKPVLVVHPRVRRALRQLLAAAAVSAAVLGHGELESHVRVRVAARVEA